MYSRLLPDAEVPENDVQNILDVDPASQPPERSRREPKFLGDDVLAAALGERPAQRLGGLAQQHAMPLAGDQRGLAAGQHRLGVVRECVYQLRHTKPNCG